MRLLVTLVAAAFLVWAASGQFQDREAGRLQHAARALRKHWLSPAPVSENLERPKRALRPGTVAALPIPGRDAGSAPVAAARVPETSAEQVVQAESPAAARMTQGPGLRDRSDARPSDAVRSRPRAAGLAREQAERIEARLDRVLSLAAGVRP